MMFEAKPQREVESGFIVIGRITGQEDWIVQGFERIRSNYLHIGEPHDLSGNPAGFAGKGEDTVPVILEHLMCDGRIFTQSDAAQKISATRNAKLIVPEEAGSAPAKQACIQHVRVPRNPGHFQLARIAGHK